MNNLCSHAEAVDATLLQISRDYKHLKKFCDLGCGNGHRTMLFNKFNRDVLGIDLRDYRLAENKTFKFIQGNLFKSNLPAKSFDLIFSYDVIEHLEQPEKFLQECRRLLKDNGVAVISTPNKYRLLGAILILLGRRKFPYCISRDHDDYPEYWHLKEYSNKEMKDILEKNGFRIIRHHKIFYGLTGGMGLRTLFNLPLFHNHIVVLKKSE